MMTVKAYNAHDGYRFVVVLDDGKQIPDPSLPPPEEGQADTRPMVQDPAWVMEMTWGKEPPNGQTLAEYLANCKREAELLGAEELARRTPAEEISLPI